MYFAAERLTDDGWDRVGVCQQANPIQAMLEVETIWPDDRMRVKLISESEYLSFIGEECHSFCEACGGRMAILAGHPDPLCVECGS